MNFALNNPNSMEAGSKKIWIGGVSLLFILFSFFTALLIGAGQYILFSILFVSIILLILSVLSLNVHSIRDQRGYLLIIVWPTMLFVNIMQQSVDFPVGYMLELLIFGLLFLIIKNVWSISSVDYIVRILLIIFALYLLIALLSSILGRSQMMAALWQLQYNLKWPLMLGAGTLLVWNTHIEGLFRKIISYSWIFIAPILIVEILMPEIHSQILGPNPDSEYAINPFLGIGARYRGPFYHAGYLSIISALLAMSAVIQLMIGRRSLGNYFCVVIYIVFVLLSGQRQELMAMIFSASILAMIFWRKHLSIIFIFSIIMIGILTSSFIYMKYIPMQSILEQWGIMSSFTQPSERAILSTNGIIVAQHYFPFGSGLGTYGGAGAQKFDLSLFQDLGFGRYWWFLQGKFIVDTYWPNIIAEAGFAGAFMMLAFFVILWLALFYRVWRTAGTPLYSIVLLALVALSLLLANTPSSAILTDPRGTFIFWLIIGAAWRAMSYEKDVLTL